MAGYQFNHSFLDIDQYNTRDVDMGSLDSLRDADGGSTQTHGTFMLAD